MSLRKMKLVLYIVTFTLCAKLYYCEVEENLSKSCENPGHPLILTPLIKKGKIEKARNLAEVHKKWFLGIESYSGYLTVDEKHNSNSFFWFIPATNVNYIDAPIILWLAGGPAGLALSGTFMENGPFVTIDDGKNIKLRNNSWTSHHSLLYIDNPIGRGFSFTSGKLRTSEEEISEDLYVALIQFFELFPELQANDFFVIGESYGGKFVPAISYKIHMKNPTAKLKINLKGLAIGNGLSDPINQFEYGDFLFNIGLIDFNMQKQFNKISQKIKELINRKKYEHAFDLFDQLLAHSVDKYESLFKNVTGFKSYYNFINPTYKLNSNYENFINQCHIRKALHVGSVSSDADIQVIVSLKADFVKSVTSWISELLDHYRLLVYTGQLDIIVNYPATVNYLQKLNFSGAEEYKIAPRHIWFEDEEIAGYVKEAGYLTEVLVRNAGHAVIVDQPEWALNMITKFIRNQQIY